MHAARLDHSERLQRVAKLLETGCEYSTLEIIREASVCAVNSVVSELRKNGFDIVCRRSGDLWLYRLNPTPTTTQGEPA